MWTWINKFWRRSGEVQSAAAAGARGEQGERIAERFLRDRGFRVVARNWRNPADRRDELDLVCRDGAVLVFVEVKTRAPDALVPGYHAVDARKKAALRRAAVAYLRSLRPPPETYRLDVVEVVLAAGREPEVLHFAQVELFGKHFRP